MEAYKQSVDTVTKEVSVNTETGNTTRGPTTAERKWPQSI